MGNTFRFCFLSILFYQLSWGNIHFQRDVDLRARSRIIVDEILTNQNLRISEDVWIHSDLLAMRNIWIGDRSVIDGSIKSGKTIFQGYGSHIEGPTDEYHTTNAFSFLPSRTTNPGDSTIFLRPGDSIVLQPGRYNTLIGHANCSVTLEQGTYHFDRFELEPECQVELKGDVTILVRNNFKLADRTKINVATEKKFSLQIISSQKNTLFIGTDVKIIADIHAPNANVQIGSRSILIGDLSGDSLHSEPDIRICSAPRPLSLRSTYSGFEQYLGNGLYLYEVPRNANLFTIAPFLSNEAIELNYLEGRSTVELKTDTTWIRLQLKDPVRSNVSELCTENQINIKVIKKWKPLDRNQKISPALQFAMERMEERVAVTAKIATPDIEIQFINRTNELKGQIEPYSVDQINDFMHTEKSHYQYVKNEYFKNWSSILSENIFEPFLSLTKENAGSNFDLWVSHDEIDLLNNNSLITLIDLRDSTEAELNAELTHLIHLAPYHPVITTVPIPVGFQIPSNDLLWSSDFGSNMKGQGIKIATRELGISKTIVNNLGLQSSQIYTEGMSPHGELCFLNMYRAAPKANHYHLNGTSFRDIKEQVENNDVKIFSISYTNAPSRGNPISTHIEYIEQVRSQFIPPYPLIVGPADNQGEDAFTDRLYHQSLVSWASWASLSVGNSGAGGKMLSYTKDGRCSSSENWPAQFGSPFGDVELPHVVAPGNSGQNSGFLFDEYIEDPETATKVYCGTSHSAPLVVGTLASLMTYMPSFIAFPEIGKVVAMLTAVNAHGADAYTTFDPQKIVHHNGMDYMEMIDGVDGTGEVNAMQAGTFLNSLGYATPAHSDDRRMWPLGHPGYSSAMGNAGKAQPKGISWFWFRSGLTDATGNPTRYGDPALQESAMLNANEGDYVFPIQVPHRTSIQGKHLRCVFTWQARLNDDGSQIIVDDYDMQLNDIHGNPITPDNIGNSWENNVEVIDWAPSAEYFGKEVYLTLQGSLKGSANVPAGAKDLRAVVAWEWVKSQPR